MLQIHHQNKENQRFNRKECWSCQISLINKSRSKLPWVMTCAQFRRLKSDYMKIYHPSLVRLWDHKLNCLQVLIQTASMFRKSAEMLLLPGDTRARNINSLHPSKRKSNWVLSSRIIPESLIVLRWAVCICWIRVKIPHCI